MIMKRKKEDLLKKSPAELAGVFIKVFILMILTQHFFGVFIRRLRNRRNA